MMSMLGRWATGLLMGMGGCGLSAAGTSWTVDASASSLAFSGSAQGEAFTGAFKRFTPRIVFDPADLAGSRFEVSIDLGSADSQNAERDEVLLSNDFFAIEIAATAEYRAEEFESLGEDRYRATGVLTLKGLSHPVSLDFHWQSAEGAAHLSGEAILNRLDFQVGSGEWADTDMIASEVRVTTTLSLVAVTP